MGGVGKTTLARFLYNEQKVKDHYELMAWVCVSDEFDIFKLSKNIFQSFTRENKEFGDFDQLQIALSKHLKDKRFLLVLDDVWSENDVDWKNLVKPFHSGAPQSVDNFDSHTTLKSLGEGIVKKCGCLPLALRALGRLLRTKTDEQDWEDVLNSEIWDLEKVDEIVPALRLSYYDLPACLKQLFAYCSLFPKDFMFDKDALVLLWMAEGFLNQSTGSMTQERLGHDYFDKLLARSFFQRAPNEESMFMMHDLMNDLATFVAGDLFLRFDGHMEEEALAKYRHMSFICEEYVGYDKFKAFKRARNLRTFLAVSLGVKRSWDCFYLSNKVLVDLLPELSLLRVICLTGFEISEVPSFIVKLPKSFLKLKKLKHFDIRDTPLLKRMPLGIGELKSLQTLTKIIIGGDDGFALTELKYIKNLQGKISIKGLDRVQTREAYLSLKMVTELELEWGNVFDGSQKETLDKDVLDALNPRTDQLKKLEIVLYGGIDFPSWVGDPLFIRLTQVSLRDCKVCTSLPSLGRLPFLKELFIKGLDGLKVVGLEFLGTSGVAFPSLELLCFEDMKGWTAWSTKSRVLFPCLRELRIMHCPNLVDISLEEVPSLRVLEIDGCGDRVLTSTVRAASLITKLEIKSMSGVTNEVWRGIIEYLGKVEELRINWCNDIKYLWASVEEAEFLVNVRKLVLYSCEKLVSFGEKEEDIYNCGSNLLPSLRNLEVWICESMERCSCPNSIETLTINDCSSITSISFATTTGRGHTLKSLEINNCKKLLEKEFGGEKINNTSMPIVEYVKIVNWPNLKSNIELSYSVHLTILMIEKCPYMQSFPNLQLPNLTHLIIYDCQSMMSFPDHQLPKLASLKHMRIRNCPSMNASFPQGFWPPNLCTLEIGGLKKPISKWGPQNFPTSLVELELIGEHACHDVTSLNIPLSSFFTRSIGDGVSIKFWDEEWLGSFKLAEVYPRLYALESMKDCNISDRLFKVNGHLSSAWNWRRSIRDGREKEEMESLVCLIQGVELKSGPDGWSWALESSGKFSVKSLRVKLDENILTLSHEKTRWNPLVPKKVNILVWRADKDSLATRCNLDKRCIDLHSILCPMCEEDVESLDHLMGQCSWSRSIWNFIFKWWGFSLSGDLDYKCVSNFVNRLSTEEKRMFSPFHLHCFEAVIFTSVWYIWRSRNDKVFRLKESNDCDIFKDVQSISFCWRTLYPI
ncbi:NB-ARC domains-containing protein [Artemisia annua]|uniref:NB-ARC domains-containing protein n=1 Tax=Artemisia annua TaxID=35608 RepID=A0A2U1PY70_ARTAN|nr:NB-ARC domains-containing protein [Artemisia annua]